MTGEVSYIIVFVTVSNSQEAEKIADVLLNERKAACVNMVSSVKSKFWWEGKIDSAEESMLIVKTRMSLFNEVVSRIKEVHSYEVPEIIAVPIIAGNDDYLRWISDEVK
jgi:periplasmic divalent cation tolerance protein